MRQFLLYLFQQRRRADPVGDLARDAFMDPFWSGTLTSLKHRLPEYAQEHGIDLEVIKETYERVADEYREDNNQPVVIMKQTANRIIEIEKAR